MKLERIKVWSDRVNAHFHEGQTEVLCTNGHRLGRDDTEVRVRMKSRALGPWCALCLRDPDDIRRELRDAERELRQVFDLDAAMLDIKNIAGTILGGDA